MLASVLTVSGSDKSYWCWNTERYKSHILDCFFSYCLMSYCFVQDKQCQKDGEQQLQWEQMMAHSPGYLTDNNRQPDREERSREKQRGLRCGS